MQPKFYPSSSLCVNPVLKTAPNSVLAALARAEGQAAEHDSQAFSKDKLAQLTLAILAGNEDASKKLTVLVKLIKAYLRDVQPYPVSAKSVCESTRGFYETAQIASAHPDIETGEMISAISLYNIFEG